MVAASPMGVSELASGALLLVHGDVVLLQALQGNTGTLVTLSLKT